MFTGIVEEVGRVVALEARAGASRLTVAATAALEGVRRGESLAVDGVCLTVVELGDASFTVEMAPETLRRTTLGALRHGAAVNLERPLRAGGFLGGHFVQGHVDGTGVIRDVAPDGEALDFAVEAPRELLELVVPKGYVAVDGVSLTVVERQPQAFTFMLVPYTQQHVALAGKRAGDAVNLELDVLGKYVRQFLGDRIDVRNEPS